MTLPDDLNGPHTSRTERTEKSRTVLPVQRMERLAARIAVWAMRMECVEVYGNSRDGTLFGRLRWNAPFETLTLSREGYFWLSYVEARAKQKDSAEAAIYEAIAEAMLDAEHRHAEQVAALQSRHCGQDGGSS